MTQVTSEAKCLDCVQAPSGHEALLHSPLSELITVLLNEACWHSTSVRQPQLWPLTPPPLPLAIPPSSGPPGLINHTYNTVQLCHRRAADSFHERRSKCALQHLPCCLISVRSETRQQRGAERRSPANG